MNKNKINEEDTSVLTFHALVAARNAFQLYLEKGGNDPAHWDIRFIAWLVDANFTHRLERIELEVEVKDEKEQKGDR